MLTSMVMAQTHLLLYHSAHRNCFGDAELVLMVRCQHSKEAIKGGTFSAEQTY